MKKFLNIIGLYLLFGIVFAAIITVSGGYENLVIRQTLGPISSSGYLLFMLGVITLWLPGCVCFLFSKVNYFNFVVNSKLVFGGILAVFLLFSTGILKRTKTQK